MTLRQTQFRSLATVTPPTPGAVLATPDQARTAEAVLSGTSDADLTKLIARYTAEIADYLGFRLTDEQDNQFFFATYEEKRFIPSNVPHLFLERWPVNVVTSVVVDGNTIPTNEYTKVGGLGKLLATDSDGHPSYFDCGIATITYRAGWAAPGEDVSSLSPEPPFIPANFLQALYELLRGDFYDEDQEPGIRSETSNQVEALSYFKGGAMGDAWDNASRLLKNYKRKFIS